MASKLSFQLKLLFNETVADKWGNWQYAGADAVEQTTKQKAKLIATKRDNSHGSVSFPASMLTATLMFEGGGPVPPNLTLQGVHDLKTNDEKTRGLEPSTRRLTRSSRGLRRRTGGLRGVTAGLGGSTGGLRGVTAG